MLATRYQKGGGGGGPQVNKFEQVSSVGHQMSVAGVSQADGQGLGVPGLMSGEGVGRLYSEVQGIMDNGHMGTPLVNRQTPRENITFPQLR